MTEEPLPDTKDTQALVEIDRVMLQVSAHWPDVESDAMVVRHVKQLTRMLNAVLKEKEADDTLAQAVANLRRDVRVAWMTGVEDYRRHYDSALFALLGIKTLQDLYEEYVKNSPKPQFVSSPPVGQPQLKTSTENRTQEQENRYIVIEKIDADRALLYRDRVLFYALIDLVESDRVRQGKAPLIRKGYSSSEYPTAQPRELSRQDIEACLAAAIDARARYLSFLAAGFDRFEALALTIGKPL